MFCRNDIEKARQLKKGIVVSGCVPQGAPKVDYLKGVSMIGVQQIDRVVEVVEETLKGEKCIKDCLHKNLHFSRTLIFFPSL